MNRRALALFAALGVATLPGAARAADPVFRDGVVTCADGSRFGLSSSPGIAAPDADGLREMCRMNAAISPRPAPVLAPNTIQKLAPGGETSQQIDDRITRALGGTPRPTGGGSPDTITLLPTRPSPPPPLPIKFSFGRDELTKTVAGCVDQAVASGTMTAAAARRFCACRVRSIQHSVTRKEYNAYIDWEVWRTTWRRRVWTVDKPKGVEEKIAAGARRMCGASG